MKKQLSDTEKVFAGFWVLGSAGIGAVFSLLLNANAVLGSAVGLMIGAGLAYYLFKTSPKRRQSTGFRRDKPVSDEFFIKLVVKRLAESYRVDHPDSLYTRNTSDGDTENNEGYNEEDEDLTAETLNNFRNKVITDMEISAAKERIRASYVKNTEEAADYLDDDLNEEDESYEDDAEDIRDNLAINNISERQGTTISSSTSTWGEPSKGFKYPASYDQEDPSWIKTIILSPQFPLVIASVWTVVSLVILNSFPGLLNSISKFLSAGIFVFLPASFFIGLSGMLEIIQNMLKDDAPSLDDKPLFPIGGLIKMIIGWGISLYILFGNS